MKLLVVLATASLLGTAAFSIAANPPARFIDLDAPSFTAALGEHQSVETFRDAGQPGVKLHNAGTRPVTVQDTVSLGTLTLAPGERLGLSCESARHLALSIDDATVHESAACGTLLRISDSQGGQQ